MSAVLPVGVSADRLTQAVEAFAAALDPGAVLTDERELREFRDPYAYKGSDEFDASAVVVPTTVEQVQAVVRIANELRVPLWTFGQGRNYTYGGPAPRVRGSVLVNLRQMNRVLEVNDELAYALVEPGVRFFDLYDHLQAGGHRLWPSIPDLGWGSVVGNTLEYGRGYTPYGDHASSVCGMEVVLPGGDLLRTGMGAMTTSRSWQAYQHGFGPSPDRLFMQSNLGIVTKMGVWLMPAPEVYLSGWARFADDAAVEPLIDVLRTLMLEGTIRNYPLLGRGVGIGQENGAGGDVWGLRFALYGRRPVVEAQFAVVEEALSRIPGVDVGRRTYTDGDRSAAANHDDRVQGGVPGMELMEEFKPLGEDTGHLDLSPVVPFTGREVLDSVRLVDALYARHGLGYVSGLLILQRSVLNITTFFFDTSDEAQTRAAYEAYADMVVELGKAGLGLYRTNLRAMDLVAEQYDFNDHALRRFQETIKDALDPNGILSPGKQGIWPRSMRPQRPEA
jgi:4-cresol dehydrogenase (hydroxylating)